MVNNYKKFMISVCYIINTSANKHSGGPGAGPGTVPLPSAEPPPWLGFFFYFNDRVSGISR